VLARQSLGLAELRHRRDPRLQRLLSVELAAGGRLTSGRVTSLLLDRIGIPHLDPARGAERLMRRLSRTDFGDAGVWFALLGALQPQSESGLGG